MDALTFLYWALGVGFIFFVLFVVIALIHLIRILKDFADASDSIKETAEKMNENFNRIADKVTDAAEQVTDYVIKPFNAVHYLTDKIGPIVDSFRAKSDEWRKAKDDEEKPKKKHRFGRRK